MSATQFVLIHDLGKFGPFDSREEAFAYGSALCIDADVTYGYEAWPLTPPGPVNPNPQKDERRSE